MSRRFAAPYTEAVRLPFRKPYDWPVLLAFFAKRATPGVECVRDGKYRRTLAIEGAASIIEIGPGPRADCLSLRRRAPPATPPAELSQQARRVFDLDAPIADISRALGRDETLRALLRGAPGVRVPGAWDGFELAVRAVLGQQISVQAATTLAGRIAARYGEPMPRELAADEPGLDRLFPTPQRLARARLNNLGLVRSRAETIRRVATAVVRGDLRLDGSQEPDVLYKALKSIKGIGEWTSQYVVMRALKHPDAFPASDLGLISAIAWPARVSPAELLRRAEHWRPWRAYAAMLLWNSLPGSGG